MYKFPELVGDSGVQGPFCGASGQAGAVAEAGHDEGKGGVPRRLPHFTLSSSTFVSSPEEFI